MAHALGYLRWLVIVAAAWAAAGWVRAQPAAQQVRFTVFSAQPIAELAFVPRAGAAAQKVAFYPTTRSPRYEYRGLMPLRFVDATSGAVVAEVNVPPEIREPLLLFSPLPEGAGAKQKSALKYQVAVLDDGSARHGPGGLAIVNLSGLALTGTVNRDDVTLKAGLNPTLAVGRTAKVALRTTFNKRIYQSYAATIALTARQRALLILFPPFYKGSLEVQSRLLVDEPAAAGR